MVFTKLLLQNTPAIRLNNYEAASEPLLSRVKATFHSTIFDIPMRPVHED